MIAACGERWSVEREFLYFDGEKSCLFFEEVG